MRKDVSLFSILLAFTVLLTSSFTLFENTTIEGFHINQNQIFDYNFSLEEKSNYSIPFTGNSLTAFKQAVAIRESAGFYHLKNCYGYMGKYQFGKSTLRTIGINDFKNYLKSPLIQEASFEALMAINKWELRKEINKYCGRTINGLKITESGLLAAAHLGGASSVKTFLRSNGKNGFTDGFGTSIRSYIKRFGGYDTSVILPKKTLIVQ